MIKKILVFSLSIMMVGCASFEMQTVSLSLECPDEVVMIKDGYEYIFYEYKENYNSEEIISYLNNIILLETKDSVDNELVRFRLDNDVIIYDNLMLEYSEKVYSIQNDITKDYFWDMINSKIISVNDVITSKYEFSRIEIHSTQGLEYTIELKEQAKRKFIDSFKTTGVLVYGSPERSVGDCFERLVFDDAYIDSGNGVYVYVNNELITNKQSDWMNGFGDFLSETIPEGWIFMDFYEDDNVIIKKIK